MTQNELEQKASTPNTAWHSDARGRVITVRKMNALQVYRLTKVLGQHAANQATLDMATLASTVCRIDTQDIAFPASDKDIEFVIQQLDFDGIAAAAEAMKKLSASDEEILETAKN